MGEVFLIESRREPLLCLPVGSVFAVRCVEDEELIVCDECAFYDTKLCQIACCRSFERSDGKCVHYEFVKLDGREVEK